MSAHAVSWSGPVRRRQISALYDGGIFLFAVLVAASQAGSAWQAATEHPQLWAMTGLALLAGTQAIVAARPRLGPPVIICPTICFTFAIAAVLGASARPSSHKSVAVGVVALAAAPAPARGDHGGRPLRLAPSPPPAWCCGSASPTRSSGTARTTWSTTPSRWSPRPPPGWRCSPYWRWSARGYTAAGGSARRPAASVTRCCSTPPCCCSARYSRLPRTSTSASYPWSSYSSTRYSGWPGCRPNGTGRPARTRSPAWPTAPRCAAISTRSPRSARPTAVPPGPPCCSWTSTGSRTSTTRSVTTSATNC